MDVQYSQSYRSLLEVIEECPGVVAILADSHLATLVGCLPLDPAIRDLLLGEALVRLWLYQDRCPDGLVRTLRDKFDEMFLDVIRSSRDPDNGKNGYDQVMGGYLHLWRRIKDFESADGIIPLVHQGGIGEGVALPFCFNITGQDQSRIRDRGGYEVQRWQDAFTVLGEGLSKGADVVLLSEFGNYTDIFVGASFGLPIALARERKGGESILGEFRALEILVSGCLRQGRTEEVTGTEAKAALAKRLGARFAVVAIDWVDNESSLGIQPNTPTIKALETIARFIEECGISRLTPRIVLKRITQLESDVRMGSIPANPALRKLDRYEKVLRQDDAIGPQFDDGRLHANLLRATLLNHAGQAEEARKIIEEIQLSEAAACNPPAMARALAARVVALTDMGLLEAAGTQGRELLVWSESGRFQGSAEDRVKCMMTAHGVLGGQPLLQKALADPTFAEESRTHLETALKHADDLGASREIAFDLVQLVLWRALHDPSRAEQAYQEALERITGMDQKEVGASKEYLDAHRFLAAYRSTILGYAVRGDVVEWTLPEQGSAHSDWLRATSLKYRASVRAKTGDLEGAAQDFAEGLKLMEFPTSPLLRFISGTIAVEAFLVRNLPGVEGFRADAVNRLESLPSEFPQRFRLKAWIEVAREPLDENREKLARELRLACRY